jgi:heme/copper-type cytochrome/quinol oxidase subunit 3
MAEISMHGHASDQKVKAHNENLKLAFWLYLGSEVVLFAMMIAGYIIFRFNEPEAVRNLHSSVGIALVTANTFILLATGNYHGQSSTIPYVDGWRGCYGHHLHDWAMD